MASDLNSRLSQQPLSVYRKFAGSAAVFLGLVFGWLIPWVFNQPPAWWPWWLALGLIFLALVRPLLIKPIHIGFHVIVFWLQLINTRIVLTLVWILLIVPIGLMKKLSGHERINIHQKHIHGSNRFYRKQALKPEDMERPF